MADNHADQYNLGTVAQLSNATCDICHKLFCSLFPVSENTLVIVV